MSKTELSKDTLEKAFRVALEARSRAYAPYSKFHVGAALVLADGEIFGGCNIENASYGATNCAERTAVFSAVAEKGNKMRVDGIVIVANPKAFPCGICLQVMGEFFPPNTPVYLGDESGVKEKKKFSELLPNAFVGEFLKK
jgi:cytidine deaminase